jgi:hypothetical protein
MGISGSNRIVTFTCVVCTVGCNAAEFLVRWDLVEQVWQHRGVANATAGDFDRTYLQRFFINPDMYLAPKAAFGTTMLACIPLTFALSLDAGAVYQKVQWPCRTFVRNGD